MDSHGPCFRPASPLAGVAAGVALPAEAAAGPRLIRRSGLSWREALLGTAAAGALSLAIGGPAAAAPALCVTNGAVATCSGDQSAGILSGADFNPATVTTLNVNNLTRAITPASGTSGIGFGSNGAINITSDTGAFGISTTGNFASGISANTLGGAVTVTSTGNMTTQGNQAYGIFAGSHNGSTVTVISIGNIATSGIHAHGIAGYSNGGAVTVTSTGNLNTQGRFSNGIYAYSSGGVVTVTATGNIDTKGDYSSGIQAKGVGGGATVTSTGNITTKGIRAYGIFARGPGAVTVTSTGNITTAGSNAYGINARSQGGAVMVTSSGNISTTGISAIGIYAKGVGGGATVTSTGNISTTGNGAIGISAYGAGPVTVTSAGNISTAGIGAYGISATSLGGGAITVTSAANISTAGNNASGIIAYSPGGGPIAVTIKSGTVSGGSGTGAGVSIVGGSNNTLNNFGTVTALSGLAIGGNTGNNTVNNFGTVTGSVNLGSGANAFNNMAGGLFNAGATVFLGAGNVLTNAGTLSPGGVGVIQTTALTGNLVQTATGLLLSDINIAGATSDRVNVSGTANLAGTLRVQVQNATLAPWQQTVLSATGGTTTNGLSLLASPALQAQLVFPNATDVVVRSSGINFVTPGLNNNQTSLANGLNGAAPGAGLSGPIFNALLGPTSPDGYRAVLNQLSSEAATGTRQVTFDAMGLFMGTMLDPYSRGGPATTGGGVNGYASEADASANAADGRQRTGAERAAYAMFTKAPPPQDFAARWSLWAAGFGGSQTTDGNAVVGSNSTTSRIAAGAVGADYRFSPDTVAGFALAGGGTNFVLANGFGSGRSDLFQAGAYVRHTIGPAYIAGALAYGWQDVTTNRTVTLAGLDQLQGRFNTNAFSGRLEGGYRFVSPWMGVGVTPYAAGQFTTLSLPAYAEQATVGTNNFALAYGAKTVTAPRSELGFRTDRSFAMTDTLPGTTLTLRGRFAWAHDYATNRSIAATFQTLPGAAFVVNGAAQSADKALTTAGAELKWQNGFSLSGTFEGEFGSNVQSYSGKAVARYQW